MEDLDDRLGMVDRVQADPPQVHVYDDAPPAPGGVWGTASDCYAFLARHCPPGTRTLETGLGISTVLFAAWGVSHICVVSSQGEADRCLDHLRTREIDHSSLRFAVGDSSRVLPGLETGELDLVMIDGCHGYPVPVIDWFYGASRLRQGGIVVIDDAQLPQVRDYLLEPLDRDPRWQQVERTDKWAAYRRESSGWLSEEWFDQPYLGGQNAPAWRRIAGALRRALRRP